MSVHGSSARDPGAGGRGAYGLSAERVRRIRRIGGRVALVLAGFAAVMAAVLIYNAVELGRNHPLDHVELAALQQQVRAEPNNAALQARFRQLDAELRGAFDQRQSAYQSGGWLVLIAAGLGLVGAKLLRPESRPPTLEQLRRQPTDPPPDREGASGWAVAAVAVVVVGAGVALGLGAGAERRDLETARAAMARAAAAGEGHAADAGPADALPPIGDQSDLPYALQWPAFRGPEGAGRAADADAAYPVQWDAAAGTNLAWKTSLELPGHNSPVIWGDRLFCSGADAEQRAVYAIDIRDGSLLWQHRVPVLPRGGDWPPDILEHTGYAAPTCATDGKHVFAIFPNGDLIACDMQGRRVWSRPLGQAENEYGYASSLACRDGLVFVQWDNRDVSRLLALDAATGEVRWEADALHPSWASPVVVRTGGQLQLIRITDGATVAYAPADGRVLWHYPGPGGDVASTPVCTDRLTFLISPSWRLYAVPTDGQGPLGEDAAVWTAGADLPDIASPLVVGDRLIVLDTYGTLNCYNAADGVRRWQRTIKGDYNASPAAAGDRLYLTSIAGRTTVMDISGDQPRPLGQAKVDDRVHASLAFQDGRIYVRGKNAVYCIQAEAGDE